MEKNIKKSFQNVKKDIDSLRKELFFVRSELEEIKKMLLNLDSNKKKSAVIDSTHLVDDSTHNINRTAHFTIFKALKPKNLGISTGNEGVSTDRQTDRQADNKHELEKKANKKSFNDAIEILDTLGNIKKEIKSKFRRLTDQEFLIFSTIYQLDNEIGYSTYRSLSTKLNLTESSIRDYVSRLINKGIPIKKIKVNNKTVQLTVSENFKKIVSLPTLLQLREV